MSDDSTPFPSSSRQVLNVDYKCYWNDPSYGVCIDVDSETEMQEAFAALNYNDDVHLDPFVGSANKSTYDLFAPSTSNVDFNAFADFEVLDETEGLVDSFENSAENKSTKESDYWKSLKGRKKEKQSLITRYQQLLHSKGEKLGRDAVNKRLRIRCDAKVATDIFSDDVGEQDGAIRALEGVYNGSFYMRPLDKRRMYQELVRTFNLSGKEASDVINIRLKHLPYDDKKHLHNLSDQEDDYISHTVSRILCTLKNVTRERKERRSVIDPSSKETSASIDRRVNLSSKECPSPWDTLDIPRKESLIDKYMALVGCERKEAYSKLSRRGDEDTFEALLQQDDNNRRMALRKLDSQGGDASEILTTSEKKAFWPYLRRLHNISESRKHKVISIDLKGLNQEDKTKAQSVDHKGPDFYCWLADVVYSAYKIGSNRYAHDRRKTLREESRKIADDLVA